MVQSRAGIGCQQFAATVARDSSFGPASLRPDAVETLSNMAIRRLRLWPERHDPEWLDAIARGQFRFLNQSARVDGNRDADREMPRLWWFHWHCQESLLELAEHAGDGAAWNWVLNWLDQPNHQSPSDDPDAWHPFCLSRRLPVWLMLAARGTLPDSMRTQFWTAVHLHTSWLSRRLEWDLGGNHLLENLRTLFLAHSVLSQEGLHLACSQSQVMRWISNQLDLQVLPTGEHYERTPTYHALMLMSLIEVQDSLLLMRRGLALMTAERDANLLSDKLNHKVAAMQKSLKTILHPDGMIPLFGDSVFGETPSPLVLTESLADDDCKIDEQPSDYWIDRTDLGCCLIFDHGDLACDHLPAHGHADLLNLEASWRGRRLIVDRGTFDYEDSRERQICRGTVGHNTLQVDDLNHADVWSRFRMGRRGHVTAVQTGTHSHDDGSVSRWCLAGHDAYAFVGVRMVYRLVLSRCDPRHRLPEWVIVDVAESKPVTRVSESIALASRCSSCC